MVDFLIESVYLLLTTCAAVSIPESSYTVLTHKHWAKSKFRLLIGQLLVRLRTAFVFVDIFALLLCYNMPFMSQIYLI